MSDEQPHFTFKVGTPDLGALGINIPNFEASGRINLPSFRRPTLRTAELIRIRYRLRWRAIRDGRKGIPAADGEDVPAAEYDVVSFWRSFKRRTLADMREAVDRVERYLSQKPVLIIFEETMLNALRRAVRLAIEHPRVTWRQRRRRHHNSTQDFEAFRQENAVTRLAKDRTPPIDALTAVFVLVVAETLASALIIMAAVKEDLATAFFLATIFCVVNSLVGIATGYFVSRLWNRRSALMSTISIAGMFATTVIALAYNTAIAKFRDMLQTEGWDSAPASVNAILFERGGPGAVSTEGLALVLLGMLSFVIAVYKGRNDLDDPLAGYGKLSRRRDELELAHDLEMDIRRARAAAIIDAAAGGIRALKGKLAIDRDAIETAEDRLRQLAASAPEMLEELQEECTSAIKYYRETNIRWRSSNADRAAILSRPIGIEDETQPLDLAEIARLKHEYVECLDHHQTFLTGLLEKVDQVRDEIEDTLEAASKVIDEELTPQGAR